MPANRKPRRVQPRPKSAPAPFERGLALHRGMRLHPHQPDRAVAEGEACCRHMGPDGAGHRA